MSRGLGDVYKRQALGMSMHLATQLEITIKETISAAIMVVLTIVMLLERSYKEVQSKDRRI